MVKKTSGQWLPGGQDRERDLKGIPVECRTVPQMFQDDSR